MEKEDEVVFSHFKLLVDILRKEIFTFKFISTTIKPGIGWMEKNTEDMEPQSVICVFIFCIF